MGLSETILAAMIGAAATLGTALFQMFVGARARAKIDTRPKRSGLRSLMTLLALILASAIGGFTYSELRAERSREETRELRTELNQQLQALASSTARLEQMRAGGAARSAESVVHVPACQRPQLMFGNEPVLCSESDAQRVAVCAVVPVQAKVGGIQLFARPDDVQQPWDQSRVSFNQDAGEARFTDSSFEYAQGIDTKAVCVNFVHWSSAHAHVARMVVEYSG